MNIFVHGERCVFNLGFFMYGFCSYLTGVDFYSKNMKHINLYSGVEMFFCHLVKEHVSLMQKKLKVPQLVKSIDSRIMIQG